MPILTRTIETDVCVVGAGVIGLAHAIEARRRGLSVVVLERGACATGASVRDSGHLFFSGLSSGDGLEQGPHGRELWLDIANRAGITVDVGGTLIVARRQDELEIMEAAAADPARQARIRSAKKIGKLAPIPVEGVIGGFHAKQDLRIDSRSAPAALARLLTKDPSARVEWGAHVHEIEPGAVYAGALKVRARAIVACPGADGRTLPARLWPREAGVTLRETQMLRVAAPTGNRYRQTLMTGMSLLELPAFWGHGRTDQLRNRLELESPELVECGVSLVISQLRSGSLTVGGTAAYTPRPRHYSRERLDQLILAQAEALLGAQLSVRQRWRSVSVGRPTGAGDYLISRPMPTVAVVQALRPTAIALCHERAGVVLDQLFAEPPPATKYIRVQDLREATGRASGLRDHPNAFGLVGR